MQTSSLAKFGVLDSVKAIMTKYKAESDWKRNPTLTSGLHTHIRTLTLHTHTDICIYTYKLVYTSTWQAKEKEKRNGKVLKQEKINSLYSAFCLNDEDTLDRIILSCGSCIHIRKCLSACWMLPRKLYHPRAEKVGALRSAGHSFRGLDFVS